MKFKTLTLTSIFGISTLLAGCGGGGSSNSTPSTSITPTVTSVTSDRLMYANTTKFTVTGQNLDQGINFVVGAFLSMCSGMTEAAGGTATQRVFSCSPTTTGTIPVVVQSNSGSVLFEKSLSVPLPQVSLKTSMGDMLLELYPNNAPITVNNFLQYVWSNFYTNLIFHRVVPGFVIQGGGFNSAAQAATTRDPIKLEVPNGLSNLRGTVAMARTSALNSATSQFYINTVDNVALDTTGGGYAVFGKVASGLSVVDAISAVQTSNSWPATPVVITSATQTQ